MEVSNVRGLRASIKDPARTIAVRRGEREDETVVWQIETQKGGAEPQVLTITEEALAVALDLRHLLLNRDIAAVASIVSRRHRANIEQGQEFVVPEFETDAKHEGWIATPRGHEDL